VPRVARCRVPQIAWVCALSPAVCLILFVARSLYIRAGLGHYPTPFFAIRRISVLQTFEPVFAFWVLFAVFAAPLLWLVCFLFRPLRPAWPRTFIAQVLTYGFGWFLASVSDAFVAWVLD
jgi:hypothetical protein